MNTPIPLLIVGDWPKNLVVLESVLETRTTYQLVMVQSAQEALHALLKTDFSAVLLESEDAGQDGLRPGPPHPQTQRWALYG